ncbi:MAG: hypothetical protein N3C12_15350 [Candidatus Binatia bacterium]|nr:hypothetical protein [Candidatus Binatia bacterium]
MLAFGLIVYADLTVPDRSNTRTGQRQKAPTIASSTPAPDQTAMLGAIARVTLRLNEMPFPLVLPTPTEENFGEGSRQWVHRLYEFSLPRTTNIAPLLRPFEELQRDFPDLTLHIEDRPHSLEVWLGIGGLRTHTFRFRWIDRPPRLAIVLAHLGDDVHLARQFLALGVRLTYAVRPPAAFGDIVSEQLRLAEVPTLVEVELETESGAVEHSDRTAQADLQEALAVSARSARAASLEHYFARLAQQFPHASGVLLFAPPHAEQFLGAVKRWVETLPSSYVVLWGDLTPSSDDPCAAFFMAGRGCFRFSWSRENELGSDPNWCRARIASAVARAQSLGELIEVLPASSACLTALRTEFGQLTGTGIELVDAISLVQRGLSFERQF